MTSKLSKPIVFLLLLAAGVWLTRCWESNAHRAAAPTVASTPAPQAQATPVPSSEQAAVERDAGGETSVFAAVAPELAPTVLARAAKPAVDRVLVSAKYGTKPEELGVEGPGEGYDGETYPPQGFAPLPDGRLLVLDTGKSRLVWFGTNGGVERTMPLPAELRLPADVVITKDGTIVVVDHEGVETSGTVMFDADGNVKARLPQMGDGMMTDVYAVGNDIFFSYDGVLHSMKAGDTSGSASDETPSLFDQDGLVPGQVAPDGRTVVNASIHSDDSQLLVSVITGDPPEHVFSRLYAVGEEIRSVPAVQIDGQGTIYVVLRHGGQRSLLCLDGKSGEPTGHVQLPRDAGDGDPFSAFVVLEAGGLVMQQSRVDGSIYRLIECHPAT